jgi:hypothetical protein
MSKISTILQKLSSKHGSELDLAKNPKILADIISELRISDIDEHLGRPAPSSNPFGVAWLDSWAANWFLHHQTRATNSAQEKEFKEMIDQLTDLRFRERIQELRQFVKEYGNVIKQFPGEGASEPGNPPVGPAGIFDEGPEPPDGGTPEPGTPLPPPPGPDGILQENPWILYWFLSINATLILDMIDAQFTRRLNDIKMGIGD